MRWSTLGLAGGFAGWLLACTPDAAPVTTNVDFQPCLLDGVRRPASCTQLVVPLDHTAPTDATLTLRVVRLAARGSHPQADPLFLLAGGPGQAASEAFVSMLPALDGTARDRDLILVDQRGTGASAPLDCDIPTHLRALFREAALPTDAKACAAQHPHNPAHYSTRQAAADLDAVRRALKYKTINLLGVSYGTRLAMAYAAYYPNTTRSLVLDSVAPSELRIPLSFASDAQRAFDDVRARCEKVPACAAAYPHLERQLQQLFEALEMQPAQVVVRDPRTAQLTNLTITRAIFAQGMRSILYSSELVALLPLVISRAASGDYQPFVAQIAILAQGADASSVGLTLSIVCNEDMHDVTQKQLAKAAVGTFLGTATADEMLAACRLWPRAHMPLLPANWHSDAPVLALSGSADPVTPPRWAQRALSHFSGGKHVKVPHAGHNVLIRGCVPRLVSDFLARPQRKLNSNCLQKYVAPALFVDVAGPSLTATGHASAAVPQETP